MFTQVFCQMIKANIHIKLSDLKNVLKIAIEELKVNQKGILAANSIDEKEEIEVYKWINIKYINKYLFTTKMY